MNQNDATIAPMSRGPYRQPFRLRRWVVALLTVTALAAPIVSCGQKAPASNRPAAHESGGTKPQGGKADASAGVVAGEHRSFDAIPVQVVDVKFGTLTAVRTGAGTVVPVLQSDVAAQLAGVVAKVVHHAGDWVKAGDIVVQLDESQLRLAYQTAQGALKNAQINLDVAKQTTRQDNPKLQLQVAAAASALSAAQRNFDALQAASSTGGVAASDLDNAQSQLQQAKANAEAAKIALGQNQDAGTQNIAQLQVAVETAQNQLARARLNLSYASVKAPFAGQIAALGVTAGEYVNQNTAVFTLVSRDREISFNVSPGDAASLSLGHTVSFTSGGVPLQATINQSPSAPVNGVVPLSATVTSSDPPPYGTVGTVSYSVDIKQGFLVPLAGLQNDGGHDYVFTVVQGKAHIQPVVILAETGTTAAVSQIPAGAAVIVNPPPGLLEGAAVAEASSSAAASTS